MNLPALKSQPSFAGVEKVYAIQAGRELRITVDQNTINDEQSRALAKQIARRIQTEIRYSGRIKVPIIRETRIIAYARYLRGTAC
jgi:ribonuclease Y